MTGGIAAVTIHIASVITLVHDRRVVIDVDKRIPAEFLRTAAVAAVAVSQVAVVAFLNRFYNAVATHLVWRTHAGLALVTGEVRLHGARAVAAVAGGGVAVVTGLAGCLVAVATGHLGKRGNISTAECVAVHTQIVEIAVDVIEGIGRAFGDVISATAVVEDLGIGNRRIQHAIHVEACICAVIDICHVVPGVQRKGNCAMHFIDIGL